MSVSECLSVITAESPCGTSAIQVHVLLYDVYC